MRTRRFFPFAGWIALALLQMPANALQAAAAPGGAPASDSPLPPIPELMHEVEQHQKQLEKVRENYTYSSLQTTQDIDSGGQVKKTETEEGEDFFVNGHVIERMVKKNGQPLSDRELQ